MSIFSKKKNIGFNFSKNKIVTKKNLKQIDNIPIVSGLYDNNYIEQNISNNDNLGLYTYWGNYYIDDTKMFPDIQIEEFDLNLFSGDRDLDINKNPLNFIIWLNQQNSNNRKCHLPRVFKNIKYINFEHIIFPKFIQLIKVSMINDLSYNQIINDIANNIFTDISLNLNLINTSFLNYQICNVKNTLNFLQINFTINNRSNVIYEYTNNNNIIILDKYYGIPTNSPGNHIQYISIHPTNNKFILNTKYKSIFRPVFPKLKSNTDLYTAIKKSLIIYKNTDLLNIYKININLLDHNYNPIIINNLDYYVDNNKCSCDIGRKKYSCPCYYLRHPLNPKFQLELFIKIGCLIQTFNKKNYIEY